MKQKNQNFPLAIVLAGVLLCQGQAAQKDRGEMRPAPEFTTAAPDHWLNSKPLRLAEMRGKVILLNVWTFSCWNCYRSLPWLKSVQQKYGAQGLYIIGIHSPEFDRERNIANVVAAIKKHGVTYPNMIDNDFAYWRQLKNRYWPAFYLIDKQGRLRETMVGETHAGTPRAVTFEEQIRALLLE